MEDPIGRVTAEEWENAGVPLAFSCSTSTVYCWSERRRLIQATLQRLTLLGFPVDSEMQMSVESWSIEGSKKSEEPSDPSANTTRPWASESGPKSAFHTTTNRASDVPAQLPPTSGWDWVTVVDGVVTWMIPVSNEPLAKSQVRATMELPDAVPSFRATTSALPALFTVAALGSVQFSVPESM